MKYKINWPVVWDWLVKSSADPSALSLTIKAGVPYLALSLILGHFGFNSDALSVLTDKTFIAGADLVQLITAIVAVVGAVRKMKRTLGGKNAVLQ